MSKSQRDQSTGKGAARANKPSRETDPYDDYYDEDQEYAPPRRSRPGALAQQSQQSRQLSQSYGARSVQQQGGTGSGYTILLVTMGALAFIGVLVIAYLLGANSGPGGDSSQQAATTIPSTSSGDASNDPGAGIDTNFPDVPRVSVAELAALNSDESKRPVILDVRDKDQFDQQHIKGSISFPTDQIANRKDELSKDKLIIAYCA